MALGAPSAKRVKREKPQQANSSNDERRDSLNDIQNFLRTATVEERTAYNLIKGKGSQERKKAARDKWKHSRLKNGAAKMQQEDTDEQADWKVGTYKHFWRIAQDEGGLMDKEFGVKRAKNYCGFCEKKKNGEGAVVYDPGTKVLQYLHFDTGVSEKMSRTRRQFLDADVDLPEEAVLAAMQKAKSEGLEVHVPAELLGKLETICEQPSIVAALVPDDMNAAPVPQVATPPQPGQVAAPTPMGSPFASLKVAQCVDTGKQPNPLPETTVEADMDVMYKAVGIEPGAKPTPSQQMMLQSLIMMRQTTNEKQLEANEDEKLKQAQAAEKDAEDAKKAEEAAKKAEELKSKKKHKTEIEKRFSEAALLGKKLGGMADHANRIKKQANTKGDLWEHAAHDLKKHNEALIAIACVKDQADSLVVSSHIDVLIKQCKSESTAADFLAKHITALTTATDTLARPLHELIKIHNIKLQGIAMEGKTKAPPKKNKRGARVAPVV